jgi:dCTP diphosphatase
MEMNEEKVNVSHSQNLEVLLNALLAFYKARDWEQFHSPKNLIMDLAAETGELVEPFRWLTEQQSYELNAQTLQEVKDEIADVFKIIIYLSYKLGIDPIEATYQKLEKMNRKYPIDACRGKSFKYTTYER